MYCPQCGTRTEQQTKFCKSCGLKLADHARLLEEPREAERMSREQLQREKRMMMGIVLTMVTAFDLLLFFIIFGAVTLSHLEGKAFQSGLFTLLLFLFVTLVLGGTGVFKPISSGFFKNMRERQLRVELALIEHKRKALEAEDISAVVEIPSSPHTKVEAEVASVSEHTTRELRP